MAETLTHDGAFSYRCNACSRCCHDKRIQVNPYEIARLAANRGLSTGDFIAQYLENDGPYLRFTDDGACAFLGPGGCTVHPDRPLVCRLYPLGRHVSAEHGERFIHATPHPQTEGVYGTDGTVADFLDSQQAAAFIDAADRYHSLVDELLAMVENNAATEHTVLTDDWLDIDAVLGETGDGLTVERKMDAHIAAIRSLVGIRETGDDNGQED